MRSALRHPFHSGNRSVHRHHVRGRAHSTEQLVGHLTLGYNWSTLNTNDFDLGAGGPLLFPETTLLTGGGKAGTLYLLNITSADASCAQIHRLALWNRTGSNPALLYLWASNDTLKAFSFIGGLISTTPVAQNSAIANLPNGAALALSVNDSTAGSGILWAAMSTQNASSAAVPDMNPADQLGNLGKFVVPVVANGKVYMATFSNQLVVYGLH